MRERVRRERERETYTDSYPDTAIFGLWQAATSPTLFFQFIVAQLGRGCQDNDVVLVPLSPSPSPSPFSLSLLSPRMVSWLGKGVGRGGVGGGMCAGNVAKNVHLFSEVLLFVLTRVAVNCGKFEAKCLEYL